MGVGRLGWTSRAVDSRKTASVAVEEDRARHASSDHGTKGDRARKFGDVWLKSGRAVIGIPGGFPLILAGFGHGMACLRAPFIYSCIGPPECLARKGVYGCSGVCRLKQYTSEMRSDVPLSCPYVQAFAPNCWVMNSNLSLSTSVLVSGADGPKWGADSLPLFGCMLY
ncbi:hypothetical protein CRG98_003720 [Punica granatum]|uniref:Uncharacterized protein n=1 Tax=Punica granatum TaxID=22663 RepID=A0A2I0L6Z9_PUNGR|nr:hypothetical protein CRG98_003720 [Punica granatum]